MISFHIYLISGTFSNAPGLEAESNCTACSAGMYCDTVGLTAPAGACGTGYYCPTGTVDEQPPATECPVGHYCPGGTALPVPCQNGTYVCVLLISIIVTYSSIV